MMRSRLMATAVMAVLSLGVATAAAVPKAAPNTEALRPRSATRQDGRGWGSRGSGRRAAYGWTNAHARRAAIKKRNQRANRARMRGAR